MALVIAQTISARAEMRTFTDNQGRSLRGELVSIEGDKVTIKREDGQTFILKATDLCGADLAFLVRHGLKIGGAPAEAAPGSSAGVAATPKMASPVAMRYFGSLKAAGRSPRKSPVAGKNKDHPEFSDVPKEGAYLVGFGIVKGNWFKAPLISSLQPIYETANGRVPGGTYGKKADKFPIVVEAKPGYAVSEIRVSVPVGQVHGIKLVFRRVDMTRLDLSTTDSYESDWVGEVIGNNQMTIGAMTPAVGIAGRASGDWISALQVLSAP